jgi:dTDP-glucose 4,6-dehydratase
MKVLVTGGLGFIGSNFIKRSSPKHSITNIDKMGMGSNLENLVSLKDSSGYRFVKGDIRDRPLVESLVRDAELVVNFAAETHVDRSIRDPGEFVDNNVLGTFSLLEAERKAEHKIRHIQVSTDEGYGSSLDGVFRETDALDPSNPYSATKAAADLLCRSYFKTYGLDVVVTRCTNNFGPNQFPEKLIPKTIIRAINNMKIPIYGTGENVRDWIYVGDHCNAIDFLSGRGEAGEIYNVSSGNEYSNLELVRRILGILGKPEELIMFVKDRPGHDLRYSLDSGKLRSIGWRPLQSFEEALRTTVEWYISHPEWWRPMVTPSILSEEPWKSS